MAFNPRSLGTLFNRAFRNDLNANFTDVKTELDAQDTRIDNLVVSAGDSNAEIVDARGGETSLGNRLDSADAAVGTATLKTTAQTVKGAINENYDQIGIQSKKVTWTAIEEFDNLKVAVSGGYDYAPCINAAINKAITQKNRIIRFYDDYKVYSTIQINTKGLVFVGTRDGRPDQNGGSRLQFYGTGACIQLGTDDGQAYDSNNYNGIQGFSMIDMSLKYFGSSTTALTNGFGTYGTGTYGIRDWRGGDILLQNVQIENFEYGFWGVQSDINQFKKVYLFYNKTGIYLGARSDQNKLDYLYAFFNDRVLEIDGAWHTRIRDGQFVINGFGALSPFLIKSSYTRGTHGVTFNDCWFEHLDNTKVTDAFIDIDGTNAITDVVFRNTSIHTNPQASAGKVQYFAKIGNATRIVFDGTAGSSYYSNLKKLLYFYGNNSAEVRVVLHESQRFSGSIYDKDTGTTPTPKVIEDTWGYDSRRFTTANGRVFIGTNPANTLRDFFISSEADKQFQVVFPNTGDGNTTRLQFTKRFVNRNAMPTSGSWEQGDYVRNTAPTVLGTAGSQYTVKGWVRITTSSNNVLNTDWVEDRGITGT